MSTEKKMYSSPKYEIVKFDTNEVIRTALGSRNPCVIGETWSTWSDERCNEDDWNFNSVHTDP